MTTLEQNMALFNNLNARMTEVIHAQIKEQFGTPDERVFFRKVLTDGINSGERLIALIKEGLTYPKWKEYIVFNVTEATSLDTFNNAQGSLKALFEELIAADLELVFEHLVKSSLFDTASLEEQVSLMRARLSNMEAIWTKDDAMDNDITDLQSLNDKLALEETDKPEWL